MSILKVEKKIFFNVVITFKVVRCEMLVTSMSGRMMPELDTSGVNPIKQSLKEKLFMQQTIG